MKIALKLARSLRFVLSVATAIALITSSAMAVLPYNDGDILLGFRAAGGDGSTTCYLVRLGSATLFTGASGQITVPLGNLKADLDSTYGPDWSTRADLFWSVSGIQKVAGNGFTNNTMFASKAEPTRGTQSAPWTRFSVAGSGAPALKMQTMTGSVNQLGYNAGTSTAGGLDQTESTRVTGGLLQSTSSTNNYASFQPGGSNSNASSAFGVFPGGIDNTFTNGTQGSVLDFYQLSPGSGDAPLVGAFRLDNNGSLTFSKDISVFAPPGTVALEQVTYTVNEDAAGGQVAVNLVRTGTASIAFSVNFSTSNGTAVAGTDFTGQTNVPVSFAAGELTKTVNIAIARNTGFQGNREFGIAITSPTGNVSLGVNNTARVTIIEVDPAPPSVALSAASFPVNEDAGQVTVTLTRVGAITGAFSVNFSTTAASATAGTDFTAQTNVPVSFGANDTTKTVNVAILRRTGFQGNREFNVVLSSPSGAILATPSSATVVIAEVDAQPATLTLGNAAFTVAENVTGGSLAIVVTRAGVTTQAGSVTFSTADGTALAGTDYTAQTNIPLDFAANETTKTVNIAILDRSGFQASRLFTVTLSNATNGGVLGTPSSAAVTITDKDPPGAVAGNYRGLIAPTGTASNETSGEIMLTVTANRAFTGKLMLGGGSLAFSGKFDDAGAAKFKPGQATELKLKLECDTPLDLGTLTLKIVGDVIDGEVKNPGLVAKAHLERDAFDGATAETSVDPAFLANGGNYTVVLPSKAQTGLEATAFPQGDGIGFITLKRKGKLTFTGKLADGKSFTATTRLAKNYSCPVFVSQYKMFGSLAGNLTFKVTENSDLTGSDFLWVRPVNTKSAYYPAGWPAGVRLDALGASYAIPNAASVFPGLGPVDSVNGNAQMEVSDGKLADLLAIKLNISPENVVTPITDTVVKVKIEKETGKVSGKFTHSDGTKPKINAVIYQKGATRGAFGYFLSTVPAGETTGESGGVSLTPKAN